MDFVRNIECLTHWKLIFQKLRGWLLPILILITSLVVFVPFLPSMPAEGLDSSWQFAMNQAIAQGFSIGHEITFTFGPYASIYTKIYHPATDGLMLWGSIYLGLSFGLLIILLFKKSKISLQLGVLFALSSIIYLRDPLLFLYPLML